MRKVAYCAGGTVVTFPIPDEVYGRFTADHDAPAAGDLGAPCAVLAQVVAGARAGEAARCSRRHLEAACRIWQFFNSRGNSHDDVVVVDYVGDGQSIEFAPLAGIACSLASPGCACLRASHVAEPAFDAIPVA